MFLVYWALVLGAAAHAEKIDGRRAGPVSSTATVRGEAPPFSFSLDGDPNRPHVWLKYRLRWEPGEAEELAPNLIRGLFNPIDSARWLRNEFRKGTTLHVYGVRIRAKDVIVEETAAQASGPVVAGSERRERRKRLSLRPLWEDIQEDLRRGVLFQGMELAFPETSKLNDDQKRAMLNGILKMDQGRSIPFLDPVLEPMLDIPKESLERLIEFSTPTAR